MKKIIGIIDQYPIVTQGLCCIISQVAEGSDIVVAASIEHFLDAGKCDVPELLILGTESSITLEALQAHARFRKSKIVLIDGHTNGSMIQSYFRNGVYGYLSVTSDIEEIKVCLSNVLLGLKYIPIDFVQFLLNQERAFSTTTKRALTKREKEIAGLLLEGKGTTLIARELGRQPSTISTIKKNIFRKMNISGVLQLGAVVRADL